MVAWKELLEASGGKLELRKCFYYVMAWKFDENGSLHPITIKEQREICNQITITDSNTEMEIALLQKEVDEEHTILGVKKTITGS
jgi:hypothetical protein